jgi:sodium/hydrogen antiporter
VVLLSVVGHGAMLAWATHRLKSRAEPLTSLAGRGPELPGAKLVAHPELITFDELAALQAAKAEVVVLDVRTARGYEISPLTAKGAIRLSPTAPAENAASLALPREAWLVAYCS